MTTDFITGAGGDGNGQLRQFLTDAGHDAAEMGVTLVSGNEPVGTVRFPGKSVSILISEVRGAVPDGQSVASSGSTG